MRTKSTKIRAITTAMAAAVALAVSQSAFAGTHSTGRRHPSSRATGRTVGLPALTWHTSGTAHALAPKDWVIITNAQGNAVDVSDPAHTEYVGWSVSGVTPEMIEFYPIYRDGATALAYGLSIVTRAEGDPSPARLTSPEKRVGDGFFTMRTFASAKKEGAVFYHVYPMSTGGYVGSVFVAMANKSLWPKRSGLLVNMALSIRSTVLLRADSGGSGSGRSSTSKDEQDNELKDYNAQLGTQWVHSPSTGESYWVDASTDWKENGPDGPGYYHSNGNFQEKLEPGMGD